MNLLKVRWISLTLGLAVMGGLLAPLGLRSASADDYGPNPRIHHAIEALREARDELRDAPHDFHGHKREAMDAVQHAIDELEIIKDWDR